MAKENKKTENNENKRDDFKFEIKKHFCVLSSTKSGWTKEANLVSFNDKEPRFDIRTWNPDHTIMGKGITFTEDEYDIFMDAMSKVKNPFVLVNKAKDSEEEA